MVEFALVAPLFFFVVFGGIEFGLMFRSNLAIEDISRSAARIASIERDDPLADQAILQEIDARSRGLQRPIRKVIIFSATSLDAELPTTCIDGDLPKTQDFLCNSYGPEFLDVASYEVDPANPADEPPGLQKGLKPQQRSQWDNIGVYIEYEHEFITGFFSDITLTASTVEVVELDL